MLLEVSHGAAGFRKEAPLDANDETAEYDIRHEGSGRTICNTKTGEPVRLNDAAQAGLSREVAKEVVKMLRVLQPEPDMSPEGLSCRSLT
jgi:hypothetical protein